MDTSPAIWGIVNVTPDSFSDGGQHATYPTALAHARALVEEGADVLDIGGESTRPGAADVDVEAEIHRVAPVIQALARADGPCPLRVDTRKAAVAEAALESGATIVNDVSAGTHDPAMFETVARHGARIVLMHMQGTPGTMQTAPHYADVVAEVRAWLDSRARAAVAAGVDPARIWVDPGIGFGKDLAHNVALLADLEALVADGRPVLLGTSR
ncbi:MAG: dihydropteroate synthase, partial [Planctomycetota bacterium]